jgi:NAD(P)-dependent dehydrogenase (short-subunit alcohol dehydrogenase family)
MLQGKNGVVLGAGYGIGRAIALSLARRNASLYLGARTEEKLGETCNRIKAEGNPHAQFRAVDAGDWQSISTFADQCGEALKAVHFVVTTVFGHIGEDEGRPLIDADPEDLQEFSRNSVLANWYILKAFAPLLKPTGGRIVLIVADWGFPQHNVLTGLKREKMKPSLGSEAYVSAKYAQHGLAASAERMLRIPVCAIYPGIVASRRSDSDEYYDLDDPTCVIEQDPYYSGGWAVELRDVCAATEFCLTVRSVPKAIQLKPPVAEYDGLHL